MDNDKSTSTNNSISLFNSFILSTRYYTHTLIISSTILAITLSNQILNNPINYFNLSLSVASEFLVLLFSDIINTIHDKRSNVDRQDNSNDRSLFELGVPERHLWILCFIVASLLSICCVIIYIHYGQSLFINSFLPIGLASVFIAYAYSSPPFYFKYRSLGELCSGFDYFILTPLTVFMQSPDNFRISSIIHYLIIYLIGSFNVVHSNNLRDIKTDKRANIKTIAIRIGYNNSVKLFYIYFIIMNLYCSVLSIFYNNIYLNLPTIIFILSIKSLNNNVKNNIKKIDRIAYYELLKTIISLSIGIIVNNNN